MLPKGFVYLADLDQTILQDVRYATPNNFTGKIVPGYQKETIILTDKAAKALSNIQKQLADFGLGLKIFDGYRPVLAVTSFKTWALSPEDQSTKSRFYPNIAKSELLDGYISDKSTHSRGSTVDLTLVSLESGEELDMGTEFDFLDRRSNTDFLELTQDALSNRLTLSTIMASNNFVGYRMEWWHFQLKNEPFPNYPKDHFNFPVK